jgi:hypothetical protein
MPWEPSDEFGSFGIHTGVRCARGRFRAEGASAEARWQRGARSWGRLTCAGVHGGRSARQKPSRNTWRQRGPRFRGNRPSPEALQLFANERQRLWHRARRDPPRAQRTPHGQRDGEQCGHPCRLSTTRQEITSNPLCSSLQHTRLCGKCVRYGCLCPPVSAIGLCFRGEPPGEWPHKVQSLYRPEA